MARGMLIACRTGLPETDAPTMRMQRNLPHQMPDTLRLGEAGTLPR